MGKLIQFNRDTNRDRKFIAYVHQIGRDVVVEAEGGRDAMDKLIEMYGGPGYFIRALDSEGREI